MRRDAVVALVSYCSVAGDEPNRLEKTHARMTAHVAEAAAQRADLVVFPELCAHLGTPDAWVCEDLDGPTVTAMASAARAHSLYVVIPQAIAENGQRRNS